MNKFSYIIPSLISLILLTGCGSSVSAEEYRADLQEIADLMLDNTSDAEIILNNYSSVWSHSIESRGAIPIDEMVQVTGLERSDVEDHFVINNAGNIPEDFSLNIASLNNFYESSGEIGQLKQTSEEVKTAISDLSNHPEEFEKVYDEILNMYNYSERYIEMAIDPKGSLQSFNQDKNELTNDIVSQYKTIEVVMPSE